MKSTFRSRRKVSGSRYKDFRKKRLSNLEGVSALTHIGEKRMKTKRVKGGNKKIQILSFQFVNVTKKGKNN